MAIWTQDDVDELKAVIRLAAKGKIVKYGGPPAREVTQQDLPELRELLAAMIHDVNAATRPPRRLAVTKKGFQ